MPGPIPKRSEERTRRNKTGEDGLEVKKGQALPFKWPAASKDWGPEVKRLYMSFRKSGMSAYFQQTEADWLWIACDEFNDYRQSGRKSAMQLQSILSMFGPGFGISEGDRRRIKIELDQPEPEVEDELDIKRRELRDSMRKKAS